MNTKAIRTLTAAELTEVSGGEGFYFQCNVQPGSYSVCSNHDVVAAGLAGAMGGGSGGKVTKPPQKQ